MAERTSHERLGGCDGIAAVATALLVPLLSDPNMERFCCYRSVDPLAREKHLPIDFLASATGGAVFYMGEALRPRIGDSTSTVSTGASPTITSRRRCTRWASLHWRPGMCWPSSKVRAGSR